MYLINGLKIKIFPPMTLHTILLLMILFLAGCAQGVLIKEVSQQERLSYSSGDDLNGLRRETTNLLANHLLMDSLENDPIRVLQALQNLFLREPKPEYLAAIADAALHTGIKKNNYQNQAIRYYLTAALASYSYLILLDDPQKHPYNADRIQMIRIYNTAVNEIFVYLHKRNLYRNSSYTITAALGQVICFDEPSFKMPLPLEKYKDFRLCADFRTQNLTHTSRHFGFGSPLICIVGEQQKEQDNKFAGRQTMPATLLLRFSNVKNGNICNARLEFINVREFETVKIGDHEMPLEMDFSTPLAYMAKKPLPIGPVSYMINPDESKSMQGLYMLEAYNEKRIPVLLVHGLLSNTRTWMQMINTLQNDHDLRKYYQFWGFSYSSGNPILYSAKELREALIEEYQKQKKTGKSTAMFERMVVIGHSMGGLLTKTMIMDTNNKIIDSLRKKHPDQQSKQPIEQNPFLKNMLEFKHLPFIKRVIFIAVPHRGSFFAQTAIGRFGSYMIRLPQKLVSSVKKILHDQSLINPTLSTGIDDLTPDSWTLQMLCSIPFKENVPCHSIIGNRSQEGIPGGTDGIVPYSSSHLDNVSSELIVKSGHSAQQNPLAIQEIRRILLQHLSEYPDIKLQKHLLPSKEKVDAIH